MTGFWTITNRFKILQICKSHYCYLLNRRNIMEIDLLQANEEKGVRKNIKRLAKQ